jgi:hypothetical protein
MAAKTYRAKISKFDTDSNVLLVDKCATACISNRAEDFISTLRPTDKVIKGIGGVLDNVQIGRIKWQIEDDQGQRHSLTIPNSYYAKSAPARLLSP